MKRCPQCQFFYPDSDTVCDFDQATLIAAAESEIAAITNTPVRPELSDLAATHSRKVENRKSRKALPITAGLGLVVGVTVFGVWFAVQRQMKSPQSHVQTTSSVAPQPITAPSPSPPPGIAESPSPEESANTAASASSSPAKTSASHSTTSLRPVSTSNPNAKQKAGTRSVILLTSGGKVEADEVWRTKDGVWYRRDGVVTLLKKSRVKAIVSK